MPWGAAIGAVGALGAASIAKDGSKGTTSSSAPWAGQQGYLADIFNRAQINLGNPTVANQSPFTQQATQRLAGTANNPNSITNQSLAQWGKTINGDYLNADSNPYLKGAVDKALGDVQGRVNSQFGVHGGNNFGSSGHQEWLGRNLAETALPIYAQNYQQERGRQLNAAQLGPGMDTSALAGLQAAGNSTDAYQQALTDSPFTALQRYQGLINGNYGNTSTQPYYGANPLLNAVGGAAAGLGIYGQGKQAGLWGAGSTAYDSSGNFTPAYSGYDYSGGGAYG